MKQRCLTAFILCFVFNITQLSAGIIDSISKANSSAHDSVKIRSFLDNATAALNTDLNLAMELGENALSIAKNSSWKYGLGLYYHFRTTAFILTGEADSAIVYADKTFNHMKSIGKKKGMIVAASNKARALISLGKYAESVDNYHKLLPDLEKDKDSVSIGLLYSNIAISYHSSYNPALVIYNDEIRELSANKFPVGSHITKEPFTSIDGTFQKGTILYLFSDGYADQFGGPNGKKLKYSRMKEIFLSASKSDPANQKQLIENAFDNWRGINEQVDDVCVIGIRLS